MIGLREENTSAFELLGPLYEKRGLPMPRIGVVQPEEMPQPYRRLLVHTEAMTPILERLCGQRLALRVLGSNISATTVSRQVVLTGVRDGLPVELGAIHIDLTYFGEKPRELLRQGSMPMGTLLRHFQIAYICRPALFFRVEADGLMRQALGLDSGTQSLFGRCNQMLAPDRRVMADVVEVLSPIRTVDHTPALRAAQG